jgi:hypothetical protein
LDDQAEGDRLVVPKRSERRVRRAPKASDELDTSTTIATIAIQTSPTTVASQPDAVRPSW